MLKKMLGYIKELDFFGVVTFIDYQNEVVTVESDDEFHTVKFSDVEFLEEVFESSGKIYYDKDVIGDIDGNRYIINKYNDELLSLDRINSELKVVHRGNKFAINKELADKLSKSFTLLENFYELKNKLPKEPDFNVKIVKYFDGTYYTYFYACNNKQLKEVDLIKVIYMGSSLLKEEDYERDTLTYEDYMKCVDNGLYEEVSPIELQSYVAGRLESNDLTYSINNEDGLRIHGDKVTIEVNSDSEPICGVTCDCKHTCAKENEENKEGNRSDNSPDNSSEVIWECETCGYTEALCDCKLWD